MEVISHNANPFFLKELYLDGCENINDDALMRLTKTRPTAYNKPDFSKYRISELLVNEQLRELATSADELRKLTVEISMSGTRALEVISLSECRQIQDNGILLLKKCKLLRKISFLGCSNLKDHGVTTLAKQLQYLEEIDVGSTNITGESLRELVSSCLNLRQVNITGCKKLNNSDDLVLRNNNINFDSGEDVFRFHLMPDYNSDMPKITHSVLKTRSTLSLHKVYRYLIKKLQEANVQEYMEEDANVEDSIVILCNGAVLETSLQLKHVKNLHWPFEDRLLTLNYRRKDTIFPQNGGAMSA